MAEEQQQVTPSAPHTDNKSGIVRRMFNDIAPNYDLLNALMSFGLFNYWRNFTIRQLAKVPHNQVFDLAAGTADLSIGMAHKLSPSRIVAGDFSEEMLAIGAEKAKKEGVDDLIEFRVTDAHKLPFDDESFDVVTCAYGARNFADLPLALSEMHRVLKPGGLVAIIELCEPSNGVIRSLYRAYAFHVIPLLGRLLTKSEEAYSYLPESIKHVPQRQTFAHLMRHAGFEHNKYHIFAPGVCALYLGEKSKPI